MLENGSLKRRWTAAQRVRFAPGCKAKRGKESTGKGSSRVPRAFCLTLRKLRTEFNPVLTNGALFVSSREKDSYNLYSTFLEAKSF